MKGMDDLLRQARRMQREMASIQEELAKKTVEGVSGGGMVRVVCTGKQELLSIAIDEAVEGDREMLQDLVVAAVNDALRRSRELAESDMAALTGGFSFPGLS
jgi:DNA-binding YbaB/EbfC family protein